MGNISGLLGTGGGFKGTGVNEPTNPGYVTQDQINATYQGSQNAMADQSALLTALQAQNGLQNQSQVYNQLQGVVAGTGPNPAQAMLSQATGQNVANQAALMAGQRGAGSNVGLMARQAAQQGASTQQNSIGQMAQLQAQQSLNALGQAGGMANTQAANQINQTNANTQSRLQEQLGMLGAASASAANMNNINAELIGNTSKQQMSVLGGSSSGAGSMMAAMAKGGVVRHYDAGGQIAPIAPIQTTSMAPQTTIGTTSDKPSTGPLSSVGQILAGGSGGGGGEDPLVKGMGDLGKGIGTFIKNASKGKDSSDDSDNSDTSDQDSSGETGLDSAGDAGGGDAGYAKGGKVPAKVSPGEIYLPPKDVKKVAAGKKDPMQGQKIPGKPKYKGDNYANDTVSKNLESGGIVIPNSVLQSKDPHGQAFKFVAAHLAQLGMTKKKAK